MAESFNQKKMREARNRLALEADPQAIPEGTYAWAFAQIGKTVSLLKIDVAEAFRDVAERHGLSEQEFNEFIDHMKREMNIK